MTRLTQNIFVILLTACLAFHALAAPIASLTSLHNSFDLTNRFSDSLGITQVIPSDILNCCEPQPEKESEGENLSKWKLDAVKESSSYALPPLLSTIYPPHSEADAYPSPNYPFHRPPNRIS